MRPLRRLSCIALLGLAAGAFSTTVSAAEPKNGTEYLSLPTPMPTDTGKRVEVIEFFDYNCPHCFGFEAGLEAWVKQQGANIVFKRVHVGPDGGAPQQRLFYSLDALGLVPQYHQKVFDAVHVDHIRFSNDQAVFEWAAGHGIDRAKLVDVYRSFGIQARINRAHAMMEQYAVDHWPMIVIDGRWITSPSRAGAALNPEATEEQNNRAVLPVMDYLVAKAKADKR